MATDPLETLRTYASLRERRGELILDARDAGATWEQIAEAAGMSRAGVINAVNATRPDGGTEALKQ
jgi:hypothetical protein